MNIPKLTQLNLQNKKNVIIYELFMIHCPTPLHSKHPFKLKYCELKFVLLKVITFTKYFHWSYTVVGKQINMDEHFSFPQDLVHHFLLYK